MKASTASSRSGATEKATYVQYAALPYRMSAAALEILLITSRQTRRWIIPKGWPIEGREPSACAALEAQEEAGVSGEIEELAIGQYRYFKLLKTGASVPCKVNVFALKVARERNTWAEKDERQRRWCTVEEASAAVDEPQLRQLILKFGARMAAAKQV